MTCLVHGSLTKIRIDKVKSQELERIRKATRRMERRVRRALLAALRSVKSEVRITQVVTALQAGQIDEALRLLGIDNLARRLRGEGLDVPNFRDELIRTFEVGAQTAAANLPRDIALEASFDLLNPRAVRFLERYRFELIRQVSNETREAVRGVMLRSFTEGIPPRQAARLIRDSIGLTDQQARAVENFRRSLIEGEIFGTSPTDRRLSAVERAQAFRIFTQGGTTKQINDLVSAYQERLLNQRALNIARTETIRAHSEGQQELWNQAAERDLIDPEATIRRWIVTPDDRLSEHDAAIPGLNIDGVRLDEPFRTPSGPRMNPPTRTDCRCAVILEFPDEEDVERKPTATEIRQLDIAARGVVVSRGKETGNEWLFAYDANDGREVIRHTDNRPGEVSIPGDFARRIADPRNRVVAHHNHPKSTSLSAEDVFLTAQNPGLEKTFAHGHDGSIYSVSANDLRRVREAYTLVQFVAGQRLRQAIQLGEVPIEWAEKHGNHMANRALDSVGVIDYSARLSKARRKDFDRFRGLARQIQTEIRTAFDGS